METVDDASASSTAAAVVPTTQSTTIASNSNDDVSIEARSAPIDDDALVDEEESEFVDANSSERPLTTASRRMFRVGNSSCRRYGDKSATSRPWCCSPSPRRRLDSLRLI
jgi:hypothetical protein